MCANVAESLFETFPKRWLRIFSARGHIDQKTVNVLLQLKVRRRATVANSRTGCFESSGSNSCRAGAVELIYNGFLAELIPSATYGVVWNYN